jgi:hypothetical protein
MTLHTLLMILQMVFAGGLAWSCFCRLVWTDHETVREIRWAIWLQCVTSALACWAPILPALVPELHGAGEFRWLPGYTPIWIYTAVVVSTTVMQLVTAQYWRHGPPGDFQNRRADRC